MHEERKGQYCCFIYISSLKQRILELTTLSICSHTNCSLFHHFNAFIHLFCHLYTFMASTYGEAWDLLTSFFPLFLPCSPSPPALQSIYLTFKFFEVIHFSDGSSASIRSHSCFTSALPFPFYLTTPITMAQTSPPQHGLLL